MGNMFGFTHSDSAIRSGFDLQFLVVLIMGNSGGEWSRVFVYGTLRRGRHNHYLIDESIKSGGAQFLTVAKTKERFPLTLASPYGIPFMLDKPGLGHQVEGEVYEVDPKTLEVLDRLEGHPHHYRRTTVDLVLGEGADAPAMRAEAYLFPKFTEAMLQLPMLSAYGQDCGGTYIPPKDRPANYWDDIRKLKSEGGGSDSASTQ